MRMWMVQPSRMCQKHLCLCGEHYELHKMMGNLRHSGNWTRNLVAKGFLEPQNAEQRHNALADEMLARGYSHESPLVVDVELPEGKVDVERSKKDLMERCNECQERMIMKSGNSR